MNPSSRLCSSWDLMSEVWLSWPEGLPVAQLASARETVAAICGALTDFEAQEHESLGVRVLVGSDDGVKSAKLVLGAFCPTIYRVSEVHRFEGRDSFLFWRKGRRISLIVTPQMTEVGYRALERIARRSTMRIAPGTLDFEREAIETDGEGTALLTRAHWLRPGWNQGFDVDRLENALLEEFGIQRCVWLDRGLPGPVGRDSTARVARFVAPGRVLCMSPQSQQDPFAGLYRSVRQGLEHSRDAHGRGLEIFTVPAPTPVLDADNNPLPLSHLSYLEVNGLVLVPVFAPGEHRELREAFAVAFPGKRIQLHHVSPTDPFSCSFHALGVAVPA